MNENDVEQTVETTEESTPQPKAEQQFDYERLADGLAQRMRVEEEPNYDEMGYDERLNLTKSEIDQLKAQNQELAASIRASSKVPDLVDGVVAKIPEHLRGETSKYVEKQIRDLVSRQPSIADTGLEDQAVDFLIDAAIGRAYKTSTVSMSKEPAGIPKEASEIPHYDEIVKGLTSLRGRRPTMEEIKATSKHYIPAGDL